MRDSKRGTDVKNRLLDSVGESEGGMNWENRIETCVFSSVAQSCPTLCDPTNLSMPGLPVHHHMWNRWPVQVWCMRQDSQGWCTGTTLRDGMGREVGGGFSMGHTSTPMADSCQCMEKPLQYCKVISLWLKKKKKKKNTRICLQCRRPGFDP